MDGVDMDLVNMMMLQLEDELFLDLPPPTVDMATNSVPAQETKETQSVQSRPMKRQKKERTSTSKEQRSIAARHRRERINERIRVLQRMVPGGTKMDTASVLGEAVQYVMFLRDQVQMLEMAAAELAAEGGGLSSLMAEPWLYSSQPQAAGLWSGSGEAFCMADVYVPTEL